MKHLTWADIDHFYPIRWTVQNSETGALYPVLVIEGFEDGTFKIEGDPVRMVTNMPDKLDLFETLSLGIRDLDDTLLLRYMDLNGTAIWDGKLHDLQDPLVLQFEAIVELANSDLMAE